MPSPTDEAHAAATRLAEQCRTLVKLYRQIKRPRWSQADAAAWWGCSERQWRRYESGESPVPLPLLKRIAKLG